MAADHNITVTVYLIVLIINFGNLVFFKTNWSGLAGLQL